MFYVPGDPIAQGSKNAYRRGERIVLVESAKRLPAWRYKITSAAQEANLTKFETEAVKVTLLFCLLQPKSSTRRYPTTKPDLDKLVRAVLDALTGVAYKDDSQVCQLDVQKVYTYGEPGVYITVTGVYNDKVTKRK
jgi:Holliday junction resolvase RusA-like endonuclease